MKTKMIQPERCVICSAALKNRGFVLCLKCKQPCDAWSDVPEHNKTNVGQWGVIFAYSTCCNADIEMHTQATCSQICHDMLLQWQQNDLGQEVQVTNPVTGKAHVIPAADLIAKGVINDLTVYPEKTNG